MGESRGEVYSQWDHLSNSGSWAGDPLRAWQKSALCAWEAKNRIGVVEAVTGTGKSLVGTAAIHSVLELGGVAIVIVPSRALVSQWAGNLQRDLPQAKIGLISDGTRNDFTKCDVIVTTVQSAHRAPLKGRSLTLVVADEVHRYGSPAFSTALASGYLWRLGLTGTYERVNDDGIETRLNPYFSGTVYEYSYGEALADDVVAPFHLAFVGVELDAGERSTYDEAEERCRESSDLLRRRYSYPMEWRDFFARVTANSKEGYGDEESILCGAYISGFSKKKQVLAQSGAKAAVSEALGETLAQKSGTLVFTETKVSAVGHAFRISKNASVWPLDGDSSAEERQEKLRAFERGSLNVICAPRILDEGIDIPEAEVALIVAASQSRRQMIQRMGRVIRKKADGRAAKVMIYFVTGSSEDPTLGGHEAFLEEIIPHARNTVTFHDEQKSEISEWLMNA